MPKVKHCEHRPRCGRLGWTNRLCSDDKTTVVCVCVCGGEWSVCTVRVSVVCEECSECWVWSVYFL